MPESELLPPSPKSHALSIFESPAWKKYRKVALTSSSISGLGILGYCFSQFLQLRGVTNVLASRVFLACAAFGALLLVLSVSRLLPRFQKTFAVVGSVLVLISAVLVEAALKPNIPQPTVVPTIEPVIELFAKCDVMAFPVTIPAESSIKIIGVNEKGMKANKWGYDEIRNDTEKPKKWPEDKIINQAAKRPEFYGVFGRKCEFSNHGSNNLFDVAVPLEFTFVAKNNSAESILYNAMITPLDAGHSVAIYFINDCPKTANAVLLDYATLLVGGEVKRRRTKLNLPDRNVADQIMMWFPSNTQWLNETACE